MMLTIASLPLCDGYMKIGNILIYEHGIDIFTWKCQNMRKKSQFKIPV